MHKSKRLRNCVAQNQSPMTWHLLKRKDENMRMKRRIIRKGTGLVLAAALAVTGFSLDACTVLADDDWKDTGLISNGDFETNSYGEWKSSGDYYPGITSGDGGNDTKVLSLWASDSEDKNLVFSQTIQVAEAGDYRLTFKSEGPNWASDLGLYAGDSKVYSIGTSSGWGTWDENTSDEFTLEADEEVTIAFKGTVKAYYWLKVDDVVLEKKTSSDAGSQGGDGSGESGTEGSDGSQGGSGTEGSGTEGSGPEGSTDTDKDEEDTVEPVEANFTIERVKNIDDDFIGGVDVSSYISLKDSGVKYYNFEGNEVDDQGFFDLLSDSGINYIRIRVWNDPYDENGNGYGGGNCDLDKAIKMGQWATKAGMKVLIDFHYSDFWADPSKQMAPKAWADLSSDEKADALYDYTKTSLTKLIDAGVDVGMVQVGNETNNGIAGESGWSDAMLGLFKQGCQAVHDVDSDILTVVHFANPESKDYVAWAGKLVDYGVDFDVFASSYYPYWHGTLANLQSKLEKIAKNYDKKVMVAETSWATSLIDGDGDANTVRVGKNDTQTGDNVYYDFSEYGQATELREVINTIAATEGGIGVFYWEPAWLPVNVITEDMTEEERAEALAANKEAWEKYGSGWATSYGGSYDAKDAGKYYGGSAVDNQGLFDFTGHPMDTLKIFDLVKTGTVAKEVKISQIQSVSFTGQLKDEIKLPATVNVSLNNGESDQADVTWDQDQIDAAEKKGAGEYSIDGTVTYNGLNYVTSCSLTLKPADLLSDGGFESGKADAWTLSGDITSDITIKADSSNVKSGEYCLKYWKNADFSFEACQEISLDKGTYTYGGYLEGGDNADTDIYQIYVSVDGKKEATADAVPATWQVWQNPEVTFTVTNDDTKVKLGIRVSAIAGAWGAWDDMYLYKASHEDEKSEDDSTDIEKPSSPSEDDNGSKSDSSASGSGANGSNNSSSSTSGSNSSKASNSVSNSNSGASSLTGASGTAIADVSLTSSEAVSQGKAGEASNKKPEETTSKNDADKEENENTKVNAEDPDTEETRTSDSDSKTDKAGIADDEVALTGEQASSFLPWILITAIIVAFAAIGGFIFTSVKKEK